MVLLVNTSNKVNIRINSINICNEKCEKLVGFKFYGKLTFDQPFLNYAQKN